MGQIYMVRSAGDMQNTPFYMQETPSDSPHPVARLAKLADLFRFLFSYPEIRAG
jgi:hypothetical protein